MPEPRKRSRNTTDYPGADPGRPKIRCHGVFLDGGGVIVLPHGDLVRAALKRLGVEIDPSLVPRAHYRAVRQIDRGVVDSAHSSYLRAFCRALEVPESRLEDAGDALQRLADRGRSGEILWSQPAPHAIAMIETLRSAGLPVFVVTNSDGHAAENLRDAGVCDTTAGVGAVVADVIDSGQVGSEKPDTGIFRVALERAGIESTAVVHVGDMVSTDVIGARAAGIVPIHLDPYHTCRASDHRHVRGLKAIWRHVAPWDGSPAGEAR